MSRPPPHTYLQETELSRRGLFRTAGGLTAALTLGGTFAATTADAAPATFTHPGMLHNAGDINRAKVRVAAGNTPGLPGWNNLTANSHSQSTWTANPQATVYRGSGYPENYGTLYNDIAAAYQNGLRWQVAGTAANGHC